MTDSETRQAVAGSPDQAPGEGWGRPVRLPPAPRDRHLDLRDLDLRDRPVASPPAAPDRPVAPPAAAPDRFRPVPPPPAPPAPARRQPSRRDGPQARQRWLPRPGQWRRWLPSRPWPHRPDWSRRRWPHWRRAGIEVLVAGVVILAVALSGAGRGGPPAGSEAAWLERSTPTLDRLATDLSGPVPAPLSPRGIDRLRSDERAVRAGGPPPAAGPAVAWRRLLADVADAVSFADRAPTRAHAALTAAGLELTVLTGG